jgi:hypothetical protein
MGANPCGQLRGSACYSEQGDGARGGARGQTERFRIATLHDGVGYVRGNVPSVPSSPTRVDFVSALEKLSLLLQQLCSLGRTPMRLYSRHCAQRERNRRERWTLPQPFCIRLDFFVDRASFGINAQKLCIHKRTVHTKITTFNYYFLV